MKIILSHDTDHMTISEHLFRDLIVPKFIARAKIELLTGKISLKEYFNRCLQLFTNKWQQIQEVIDYHNSLGIKSCFFIGVNNGKGLNYPLSYSKKWIPKIIEQGFEVGVHGINFQNFESIKSEYDTFKTISKLDNFGIRMHYLRQNENTFKNIEKSGYCFDATEHGFKNPYKIGNMWEFPLQVMDGWVMNENKSYQIRNFEETKTYSLDKLKKAREADLKYFSILFHDRYFCKSFVTWKNWYCWFVEYLLNEGYEFTTHQEAIKELSKTSQN